MQRDREEVEAVKAELKQRAEEDKKAAAAAAAEAPSGFTMAPSAGVTPSVLLSATATGGGLSTDGGENLQQVPSHGTMEAPMSSVGGVAGGPDGVVNGDIGGHSAKKKDDPAGKDDELAIDLYSLD